MQPQNEYIEQSRKRHGYRLDHFEKKYVLSRTIELLVVLFFSVIVVSSVPALSIFSRKGMKVLIGTILHYFYAHSNH